MANLNGFVKLHRKMIEWGWYSDCVVKDVFLHILMTATFRDTSYLGYELHPGDAIIGYSKLSTELGFSVQQVRTAIKKLESTGEISKKSTNKFTIVTVENWAFYQSDEEIATNEQHSNNIQITNEQQTSNKRATNEQQHLKNVKNIKNVKNNKEKEINKEKESPLDSLPEELKEPLEAFIEMRKAIKKPLTDRALKMQLTELNKLSNGNTDMAIRILNQSTMNCWQSLYALKTQKTEKSRYDFIDNIDINEYGGE